MIVLWIVLAIIALIALIILFGNVGIRIVCREKLRVVASVCGIPITLVSDKEPKEQAPRDLAKCRNPKRALKKELKRQKKEAKKAEKRRLKAEQRAAKKAERKAEAAAQNLPTPNLKENLDMIVALIKKLYRETNGRIRIRVRRLHITVGTDDAAKTAILYGVAVQAVSYIVGIIDQGFNRIRRKDGDMTVTPDYVSGHSTADIDLICKVKIRRLIGSGLRMLMAYRKERGRALKRAALRQKAAEQPKSVN